MSGVLFLAARNLRRRKVRNVLTAITVLLGTAFVTIFIATQAHVLEMREKGEKAALVMVIPAFMGQTLSVAKLAPIEKLGEVAATSADFVLPTLAPDGRTRIAIVGATNDPFAVTHDDDYFKTTAPMREAWKADRTAAIVGAKVAEAMGWAVGRTANIPTAVGDVKLNVVGVVDSELGAHEVLVHFDYLDSLSGNEGRAHIAVAKAVQGKQLSDVASAIEKSMADSPEPVQAMPERVFEQMLRIESRSIVGMMTFMGAVFCVLTLLVTANTVRLSVGERIGDMATLRAIGYRRGNIVMITFMEIVLVCLMGSAGGAILVFALLGSGVQLGTFSLSSVPVDAVHALAGIAFGLVVAAIAGLPAALYSSRIEVVDALRAQ